MRTVLVSLGLLLCIAVAVVIAGGDAGDWPDDHSVKVLTASNFESSLAEKDLALVEFYAPWCGHCKRLAPAYQEVAKYFNEENPGEGILIGKVDATVDAELASKYGVRGYPTIKLFRKGAEPKPYEGDRSAAAIKRWLSGQAGPAVTELKQADLAAFLEKNPLTAVTSLASDSDDFKIFTDVANELRDKIRFVRLTDGSSSAKFTLNRDFDAAIDFSGDFSKSAAVDFLSRNSIPLWGELTMDNARDYMARKRPLLLMFLSGEEIKKAKEILAPLLPVAEAHPDAFAYAYLNNDNFGQHQSRLGLNGKTPNIAIDNYEEGTKYPYTGALEADAFRTWVESFVAGTLKPHMRSAEPPAKNDEPVKVVVYKTWDEIVGDKTKDVMMEVYAPWCGHCKTLAPKYEELAKKFQSEGIDHVVIAKMDGTENDTPSNIKVTGFPTLVFFPADNKTDGIKYSGAREVQDMYDFILKNSKGSSSTSTKKVVKDQSEDKHDEL